MTNSILKIRIIELGDLDYYCTLYQLDWSEKYGYYLISGVEKREHRDKLYKLPENILYLCVRNHAYIINESGKLVIFKTYTSDQDGEIHQLYEKLGSYEKTLKFIQL